MYFLIITDTTEEKSTQDSILLKGQSLLKKKHPASIVIEFVKNDKSLKPKTRYTHCSHG